MQLVSFNSLLVSFEGYFVSFDSQFVSFEGELVFFDSSRSLFTLYLVSRCYLRSILGVQISSDTVIGLFWRFFWSFLTLVRVFSLFLLSPPCLSSLRSVTRKVRDRYIYIHVDTYVYMHIDVCVYKHAYRCI